MSSFIPAPTVSVTVNPTATELERWVPGSYQHRICLENTDNTQVYQGWIESRPMPGVGTFSNTGESQWTDIQPHEARDRDVGARGAGELRFMALAVGAGGAGKYTRRFVRDEVEE